MESENLCGRGFTKNLLKVMTPPAFAKSKHLKGQLRPRVSDEKCLSRKMITLPNGLKCDPASVTKSVCNEK